MIRSFDTDALRAILLGIEQKSFSRAAGELGLSQPAISRQLKKLERQAGTPLFARSGRGLEPTEAGEKLLDYARQIVALNDEAARAIGTAVEPETVRLGMPQDFFDDLMPEATRAFRAAHPEAHVSVRAGNNHIIANEIDAGRLDVALAFVPRDAGGRGKPVGYPALRWLAHEAFPVSAPDTSLALVLFSHPCLFRQLTLAALERTNLRWRVALTTPSLQAVWAGLRAHFGIGVRVDHNRPCDIVDVGDRLRLPTLPRVELRLLWGAHLTPAAQTMRAIIEESLTGTLKNG